MHAVEPILRPTVPNLNRIRRLPEHGLEADDVSRILVDGGKSPHWAYM